MNEPELRVALAVRDLALAASLRELLATSGMRVVAAHEQPLAWLVQDGATADPRPAVGSGPPMLLLRARGDEREPTPAERELGVFAAVPLPDQQSLSSIWECSGRLLAALRSLRRRGANGAPVVARGPALIAIAISTGGPPALETLFEDLAHASTLPPIVIVQHMPDNFVAQLAHRLTTKTKYPVHVAGDFELLQPGHAWLAPGTHHLTVGRRPEGLCCRLKDAPPVRGHRPSAEILFESLQALHVPGIAVIMTGMGADGSQALMTLRAQGWATAGQDEATCAVYGMPKAARELGATEVELPLPRIGAWIRQRAQR